MIALGVSWLALLGVFVYLGVKAREFRDRRDAADLAERQVLEST